VRQSFQCLCVWRATRDGNESPQEGVKKVQKSVTQLERVGRANDRDLPLEQVGVVHQPRGEAFDGVLGQLCVVWVCFFGGEGVRWFVFFRVSVAKQSGEGRAPTRSAVRRRPIPTASSTHRAAASSAARPRGPPPWLPAAAAAKGGGLVLRLVPLRPDAPVTTEALFSLSSCSLLADARRYRAQRP